MRVLVCGSRYFNNKELMEDVLKQWDITTIIHGAARGADTLAAEFGNRLSIPVTPYPAEWGTYGRSAGPIRNTRMLREGRPDLVVAFRGVNSRGTQDMIDQARKAGVETVVVDI